MDATISGDGDPFFDGGGFVASQSMPGEFAMQQSERDSFEFWKQRMKKLLEDQHLWEVVAPQEAAPAICSKLCTQKDSDPPSLQKTGILSWEEKDQTAKELIYANLDGMTARLVKGVQTARHLWQILNQIHDKIEEHTCFMKNLFEDISSMGTEVSNDDVISFVLDCLVRSFEDLGIKIEEHANPSWVERLLDYMMLQENTAGKHHKKKCAWKMQIDYRRLESELKELKYRLDLEKIYLREERNANVCLRKQVDQLNAGWGNQFHQLLQEKKMAEYELEQARKRMDEMEKSNAEENLGASYSDSSATLSLMETTIANFVVAANSFAKLVISHTNPNVEKSFPHTTFARKQHYRYGVQSNICSILFAGFENETFGLDGIYTTSLDVEEQRVNNFLEFKQFDLLEPQQALSVGNNLPFQNFCNVKQHNLLGTNAIGDDLYWSFIKVAKAAWMIHKLAFSFQPCATIFRLEPGRPFDPAFMTSVVDEEDNYSVSGNISFMVVPGFRVRREVFKSKVYPQLQPNVNPPANVA